MTLFNILLRFHLTGPRLSPSELTFTVWLDPIGAGLVERILLEGEGETAVHLLARFCVRCVTGTSESVSSTGIGEPESSAAFVCVFDRTTDGREGFVRNLVSVCCLAMVELGFKAQNVWPHIPSLSRNTR
jgi:hypothetical protein